MVVSDKFELINELSDIIIADGDISINVKSIKQILSKNDFLEVLNTGYTSFLSFTTLIVYAVQRNETQAIDLILDVLKEEDDLESFLANQFSILRIPRHLLIAQISINHDLQCYDKSTESTFIKMKEDLLEILSSRKIFISSTRSENCEFTEPLIACIARCNNEAAKLVVNALKEKKDLLKKVLEDKVEYAIEDIKFTQMLISYAVMYDNVSFIELILNTVKEDKVILKKLLTEKFGFLHLNLKFYKFNVIMNTLLVYAIEHGKVLTIESIVDIASDNGILKSTLYRNNLTVDQLSKLKDVVIGRSDLVEKINQFEVDVKAINNKTKTIGTVFGVILSVLVFIACTFLEVPMFYSIINAMAFMLISGTIVGLIVYEELRNKCLNDDTQQVYTSKSKTPNSSIDNVQNVEQDKLIDA